MMHTLELQCHPATPCAVVCSIVVTVQRVAVAQLRLNYRVNGALRDLSIPPAAVAARRDELWKHTCAELFIAGNEQTSEATYCEFNFSPSTQWAAYEFQTYRQGMRALPLATAPRIVVTTTATELQLSAELNISELPVSWHEAELRLALSMVIEDTSGRISYWALKHPTNQPDFHHADGFALKL